MPSHGVGLYGGIFQRGYCFAQGQESGLVHAATWDPGEAFDGSAACQPIRFYAMNDGGLRGGRDRNYPGIAAIGGSVLSCRRVRRNTHAA